jgi:cytochrome c556
MLRPVLLISIATLLAACGAEPEDTRPGQPVAHRRAAFKEMIKSFETMGAMIRREEFNAAKFASLTAAIMAVREKPWQYFGPDTQYPPSKATDAVWSQPADFEARKQEFFVATDKLGAASGTKDVQVAKAAFEAVEKTCRDCHDTFKKR